MFSTYSGAKKRAKELCRVLEHCSILLPLNKCQNAIAVAGGFRNWHDLAGRVAALSPVDTMSFHRRLLMSLPPCCRPPAAAWLGRLSIESDDTDLSPAFHRYTFPYLMAITAGHRRTATLRPGTGRGQKLRAAMVFELLTSAWGKTIPKLDAETLDLIYEGHLAELFADQIDHPRFEVELATMSAAGVLRIDEGVVRVRCPNAAAADAYVESGRTWKLENWDIDSGGEIIDVLLDTLAFAAVPGADDLAMALFDDQGLHGGSSVPKILAVMAELSSAEQSVTHDKLSRIVKLVRPASAQMLHGFIGSMVEQMS